MSYVEIDVQLIGQGGKPQSMTIVRDTISYYRGFIPDAEREGEKPVPTILVYIKGSTKALKIASTYDAFKRKMSASMIDVTYLSESKLDKLKDYIEELRNE
jgi:hypothetical protein